MCARHNNQPASSFDNGMKLIRECPLCSEHYDTEKVEIIQEHIGAHLVHLTCQRCSSAMLALVMVSSLGMGTVGVVTDLTSEDVIRLQEIEPVTSDDVLTFYEFLAEASHFESALMGAQR